MIHAVFEYCSADLLPIEESPIYQDMLREYGPEAAAELVYEVYVPPLPEVDPDVGLPPGQHSYGD